MYNFYLFIIYRDNEKEFGEVLLERNLCNLVGLPSIILSSHFYLVLVYGISFYNVDFYNPSFGLSVKFLESFLLLGF